MPSKHCDALMGQLNTHFETFVKEKQKLGLCLTGVNQIVLWKKRKLFFRFGGLNISHRSLRFIFNPDQRAQLWFTPWHGWGATPFRSVLSL